MTETRILVCGDPHFKTNNLSEMKIFVEKMVALAEKEKPDLIVILGDILDTNERINIFALTESDRLNRKLRQIAPLAIVVGNHDRPSLNDFLSQYHAFNAYKNYPNVTVADTTTELTINKHRFILVPYVYPGRFEEALTKINDPYECTCIFAHQEFYGAQMGAIVSEVGDKWSLDHPLIISGHVHDYQEVQKNIIYTGTPLQHTFGNEKSKTVSLFTFDAEGNYQQTRIKLGLPKKRKITIQSQELLTWKPPKNTKVKLVISGTLEEIKSIKKLQKIFELKSEGVLVMYNINREQGRVVSSSEAKKSYLNRLSKLMTNSNEQSVYCDIFGLDKRIFEVKNRRIVIKK